MLNKIRLKHLRIRNKLLMIYILCVLIPIVVTNIVFYNVTTNNIKNQKKIDAEQTLEVLQQELRAVIDDAAGIAYLYSIDTSLNYHLNHEYSTHAKYIESLNNIRNIFNRSEKEYRTISSAVIMTNNPTVLSSGNIIQVSEQSIDSDWYKEFSLLEDSYPYLYISPNMISIIQRLDLMNDSSYDHFIKIDLNMEHVHFLFESSGFEGKVYIVGRDSKVHYSNDYELDLTQGEINLEQVKAPEKAIKFDKLYSKSRYLGGWSLHGVIDEKKILQEVRRSGEFIVYLALLNLILPSIIIVAISSNIHSRIARILRHMKKVKNQHFMKIPDESSRDEIGQLTVEFNRMIERIDSLIKDVYVADIQKKNLEIRQRQAQLHALHSQINPHFLFNALETIRMRSLMKGEGETAKTIHNMARIFRESISWKSSFVTIRNEIELIESFLEIQKYRFGDKLQYQITVEDAVYEQYIPKMTFLPFVENASLHGIEGSPGVGLITIQIGFDGEQIKFVITDNGIGMSEETVNQLMQYVYDDESIGDHVGMKNVYSRLKLCYGTSFKYDIQSKEGMGTRIELNLPATEKLT